MMQISKFSISFLVFENKLWWDWMANSKLVGKKYL